MKKTMITGSVVCGTMLVMGLTSSLTVSADDTLAGSTTIGAEVTKGDTILAIDKNINFGQKPLADKVDFGPQDIKYTVTDYTGTKDGYSISAKLTDEDTTRSLKINGEELSQTPIEVITADANKVGENGATVTAELVYTGAQDTTTFNSTVEWVLTKATTRAIKE